MDLSEGDERKFDLLSHPFRTLCIDPMTPWPGLQEAVTESTDGVCFASVAIARDELSDPNRRLLYELAYPLDCPNSDVEVYYAVISRDYAIEDLLRFADRLWPLARANFLAHVASHRPASDDLLYELVRSHAVIDPTDIHVRVKNARAAAGVPPPSFLSVSQALAELRKIHLDAALTGFLEAKDAATPVLECTRRALASQESDCSKAVGRLLRSYKHAIDRTQTATCQRIERACVDLSSESTSSSFVGEISEAAEEWLRLYRPLLVWNVHQPERQFNLDVPVAPIRALVHELCKHGQFEIALEVITATREISAVTPTTFEELAEDARLFAAISAQRCMRHLQSTIHDAEIDAAPLIAALETSGFGLTSSGPAGRLWKAFVSAAQTSPSPEFLAWRLLRELAIRLSNQPEAAAAVVALISGLIKYGEERLLSRKMLGELHDNLTFMRSFMGTDASPGAARQGAPSADKPARIAARFARFVWFLQRPRRQTKRSQNGHWRQSVRRVGILASVACCAFAVTYGFDRLALGPSDLPAAAATTQLTPSALAAQMMPQIGNGQHLELEGVRYCHYQQERLRFIKNWLKDAEDTRTYNVMIVDYNSRCSDFFYRDEDRKQVEAEVLSNKDLLESDARRIVSGWAGHEPEISSKD